MLKTANPALSSKCKSTPLSMTTTLEAWLLLPLSLGLAMGLSGCQESKSSGPHRAQIASPHAPLTAEQSVHFKNLLKSLGQVNGLGTQLQQAKKSNFSHQLSKPIGQPQSLNQLLTIFAQSGFPPATSNFSQGPINGNSSAPSGGLATSVENGDCAVVVALPPDEPTELKAGETSIPTMHIDVSGAACPMKYSVSLLGKQNKDDIDATLTLSYDAVSNEARAMADVDHLVYTGHILVDMHEADAAGAKTVTINMNMTFDATGHSQTEGDFAGQNDMGGSMAISLPSNKSMQGSFGSGLIAKLALVNRWDAGGPGLPGFKMTGNMHTRHIYQAPRFTGELVSTIDFTGGFTTPPKAVYTLNGQAISEQQFKAYESLLNLPGMTKSNDGSSTGDGSGTNGGTSGGTTNVPTSPGNGNGNASPGGGTFPEPGGWPGSGDETGALSCRVDVMIPAGASSSVAHSYSSCGRTSHLVDSVMGRQIDVVFKLSPSYTSVMTTVCQNGRCGPTAQRDFLPNEERAYDDMIGDWMIHTSCAPVAGCT